MKRMRVCVCGVWAQTQAKWRERVWRKCEFNRKWKFESEEHLFFHWMRVIEEKTAVTMALWFVPLALSWCQQLRHSWLLAPVFVFVSISASVSCIMYPVSSILVYLVSTWSLSRHISSKCPSHVIVPLSLTVCSMCLYMGLLMPITHTIPESSKNSFPPLIKCPMSLISFVSVTHTWWEHMHTVYQNNK